MMDGAPDSFPVSPPPQPLPQVPPPRRFWRLALVFLGLIAVASIGFFLLRRQGADGMPGPSSGDTNVVTPPTPIEIDPHDKDADGISDEEESKLKTSDQEFDTDGDGLTDRDERDVWHTDPAKSDTDGDGFPDGLEVINGFNPAGSGKL